MRHQKIIKIPAVWSHKFQNEKFEFQQTAKKDTLLVQTFYELYF